MAFVPKPNTGTLWENDYKKADSHPDFKGDMFFDRAFLKKMLNESSDELVKIAIAAWGGETNGRTRFSLGMSAPYVKPEEKSEDSRPSRIARRQEPQDDDDSDVPF